VTRAWQLDGPGHLSPTTAALPLPADLRDGEVLLEVRAVGVCGSDVPRYLGGFLPDGTPPPPGWPAHEVVGTVIATRAASLSTGQRVVGLASEHNALAERVISTAGTLTEVPGHLRDDEAAVIQPLATVHAALSRVRTIAGARVTVIGLGPLGLLIAHLARHLGAASVTGVDRVDRRDIAPAFGVDRTIWSGSRAWAASVRAEDLADVVIEAVGHQPGTLNDAIAAAAPDGHVVGFGVPDDASYPVDYLDLFRKRLTLTAGTTHPWPPHLEAARAHLAARPELARQLITHVLPGTDADRGYQLAAHPAPAVRKVLIDLAIRPVLRPQSGPRPSRRPAARTARRPAARRPDCPPPRRPPPGPPRRLRARHWPASGLGRLRPRLSGPRSCVPRTRAPRQCGGFSRRGGLSVVCDP
jgi:threonine dehydrogenase-like Zn-dependent dehydrogenase